MRVLAARHQGYMGTVKVPILQAEGHGVAGLDSGFLVVDKRRSTLVHGRRNGQACVCS